MRPVVDLNNELFARDNERFREVFSKSGAYAAAGLTVKDPLMQDAGLVGQFRPLACHIEEASPEVGLRNICC
jgi:hypothetical protein